MATYRYRSWAGRTVVVEAHTVEFGSAHVVFRDHEGLVVHAEDNTNVGRLTNDAATGSAITIADGESRRLLPPKES